MAVSAARRTAFEVLQRIDRDDAHADELLHSPRLDALGERDRRFVTALVMGCLRHRGALDHLIACRLRRPLQKVDPEVLAVLRIGAYQLRFMNGVPPHAAVSEAVELVNFARKRSAGGLVNAVLRHLPAAPGPTKTARLCHPEWLARRWEAALGKARCDALLKANLQPPATYFRIPAPTVPAGVLHALQEAGMEVAETAVPRAYALRSGSAARMRKLVGTAVRFQDLNSQRVGMLLNTHPGSVVLDLCAAPGGKARLLAETAPVVGSDRNLRRLQTMKSLGATAIRLLALDAERPLPFSRPFDRILVDAPCSGTGTLARNPEITWRLRPADLIDLQRRQVRILGNAMEALAPGGALIYSTCSLESEENQDVVEAVIGSRPDWQAERVLSTVPGRDPGDGFQAWRMERLSI